MNVSHALSSQVVDILFIHTHQTAYPASCLRHYERSSLPSGARISSVVELLCHTARSDVLSSVSYLCSVTGRHCSPVLVSCSYGSKDITNIQCNPQPAKHWQSLNTYPLSFSSVTNVSFKKEQCLYFPHRQYFQNFAYNNYLSSNNLFYNFLIINIEYWLFCNLKIMFVFVK